jgi:hypothetical protein
MTEQNEPFFVTKYTDEQLEEYLRSQDGDSKSAEHFDAEVRTTLYNLTLELRERVKGCALVIDRGVAFAGFSAAGVFDEVLVDTLTEAELKLMQEGWNVNTGHLPGYPDPRALLDFSEFAIDDLLEPN